MSKGSTSIDAPFGTLLGYAPGGVAIYSSNYSSLNPQDYPDDAAFRSYIGNEYMGHKWQCVEFARRFLFLTYGFVFTDVGMAYEIFSLRFLREVVNDNILPLQAFANGSRRPPIAGSLLIWQKGGEFKHTGHVAVITQLVGNKVRIAEQNVIHAPLPQGQQWTRELTLEVKDGVYTIKDTFADTEILGWMIQTADTEHSLPQPVLPGEEMKISGARLPNKGQFRGNWLNEKVLPVGNHPLQLYSLGTPNGQKVTIMLEELLALGVAGAEYDAWLIRIGEGDQFSSGFVEVNPNSKIPALSDHSTTPPTRVFESGSILLYLAEKFGFFLPKDPAGRTETLNWLFWLQGAAPFLGGGFGHFYNYAPVKIEYAIDRFTMEAKRQLDVLDKQLARGRFVAGEEYTIADMAIWPWYGNVVLGNVYNAAEFLDAGSYVNVLRWAQDVGNRPAVKRGRMVNRTNGPLDEQLHERHDARDFDTQTEDKRQA